MTTSPSPRPPDDGDDADDPTGDSGPFGSVRPVSPGALTGWLVAGLVGGWALRRICAAVNVAVPEVSWTQILVLVLVTALLGATAYVTRRAVQTARADLQTHHAVNRLVLARASAMAGALLVGGYAGHALSWVGAASHVADDRLVRALLAAAVAAVLLGAALALERACRAGSGRADT